MAKKTRQSAMHSPEQGSAAAAEKAGATAHKMPKQSQAYPWGQWRVKEAQKSVERAEARMEQAKEVLAYVESTVADNAENAARLKLEAKQARLKKQLTATDEALAAQPA